MFDPYSDDPFCHAERDDDDFRLFICVMAGAALLATVVGLVVLT